MMGPIVALAASALVLELSGSEPSSTACICPEVSSGWMLFDDSSRRAPDSWWQDSLEVQEISLCPHGITFVFLGRENGSLHLISLFMVDPEVRLPRLAQKVFRRGDPAGREKYARIVEALRGLSGGRLDVGARLDLRQAAPEDRPWILNPARRFVLRWHGREVPLRGYLDVYLGLIS